MSGKRHFSDFDDLDFHQPKNIFDNHRTIPDNKTNRSVSFGQPKQSVNHFSVNKYRKAQKHKRNVAMLVCIYLSLILGLVGTTLLIWNLTVKNSNQIAKSKDEQILHYRDNDTKNSIAARQQFDKLYDELTSSSDGTDIKQSNTLSDLKPLKAQLDKISFKTKKLYQKRYNSISEKIKIQQAWNKMFVDGNDTNALKADVTPQTVYNFNRDYNGRIAALYDDNNDDAFVSRINSSQTKLTNDANKILKINQDTTNLFSQLGDNNNGWTYIVKDNVVSDKASIASSDLKLINNSSSLISVADVKKEIDSLNYDWSNQLKQIKKILVGANRVGKVHLKQIESNIIKAKQKQNESSDASRSSSSSSSSSADDSSDFDSSDDNQNTIIIPNDTDTNNNRVSNNANSIQGSNNQNNGNNNNNSNNANNDNNNNNSNNENNASTDQQNTIIIPNTNN